MLGVVTSALAVVCKRIQQLPTVLGPAVHCGKDTTYKTLETMCNARSWPQQCWKSCANHCYALAITEQINVGSCWFKSLTGFKLWATTTTPNNTQQGVQTDATSNDAVSCWPAIGSLSNNDGDGNENGKKLANQQLFTCIMLFCTFLCRSCTTTTWNCLTLIQFSRIQLAKIRQFKIRQHLTKWTRRNKRD